MINKSAAVIGRQTDFTIDELRRFTIEQKSKNHKPIEENEGKLYHIKKELALIVEGLEQIGLTDIAMNKISTQGTELRDILMHETQPKDLIIFTGEKIQNHIHTLGIAEKIKRIREETDIVMIGDYDWQNYDKVNRDLFMKKPFTIKDFKGRILNLLLQRNDFNPLEKLKIRLGLEKIRLGLG